MLRSSQCDAFEGVGVTAFSSWGRRFLSSFFFFQAEDGIRDHCATGVQTCALPICKFRGDYSSRSHEGTKAFWPRQFVTSSLRERESIGAENARGSDAAGGNSCVVVLQRADAHAVLAQDRKSVV